MQIKNKKIVYGIFALLVAVQLYVPASMIIKREITLQNGIEVKFKARPVDPGDPFMGRYVSVNIGNRDVPLAQNSGLQNNQTGYVILEKDADGFYKMSSITGERPQNQEYFKAKVQNIYTNEQGIETAYIKIPFDRYYMEEAAAPEAEKAYRERVKADEKDVYVTVKIKDGFAVLSRLYIGGVPIEEYLKKV